MVREHGLRVVTGDLLSWPLPLPLPLPPAACRLLTLEALDIRGSSGPTRPSPVQY